MSESNKKPLDFDEVVEPVVKVEEDPRIHRGSMLELIPISIIVLALVLRRYEMDYSSEVMIFGGGLAALLYLLFSWYMFKINRYQKLEIGLSVLCGLVFPVGILGLVAQYEGWRSASDLLLWALYAGASLFVVALFLFLFNIRDERASVFYRNLLARLLVFCALLIRLNWG